MNTWVLCLSRRKAFEWTIRSRSRWNAVRMGSGGSSRSRPFDSATRVARSPRIRRSRSSWRSRIPWVPDTGLRVAPASEGSSPAEHPVVQVGERLPRVSLEPGGLALGGRMPGGRGVRLDSQVAGHALDPEVVPRVRDQERAVESGLVHASGRRPEALEGAGPLRRDLDGLGRDTLPGKVPGARLRLR